MFNYKEVFAESDEEFISLASEYGKPIQSRRDGGIIDILTARKAENVTKNSLSKKYGIGEFPIHTDCAYLTIPPKIILLRYIGILEKVSPTILVPFDINRLGKHELDFIKNVTWFVKGQDGGFYSRIYQNSIVRYDYEVMKLVNTRENVMDAILNKMDHVKIEWTENKVVIVNNWQTLHYRPNLGTHEENYRILQRINIL